jgi:hypothetical protein
LLAATEIEALSEIFVGSSTDLSGYPTNQALGPSAAKTERCDVKSIDTTAKEEI